MQLYNEKLYDLMSFDPSVEHKLRYNNNEMFFVEGIKSVSVESLEEAMYTPLNQPYIRRMHSETQPRFD